MLGHKFPNPELVLYIFHVSVGVFALFIMFFTFCGSLSLTRISLSLLLKIVARSSNSHSKFSSSEYFLASLNMDLK